VGKHYRLGQNRQRGRHRAIVVIAILLVVMMSAVVLAIRLRQADNRDPMLRRSCWELIYIGELSSLDISRNEATIVFRNGAMFHVGRIVIDYPIWLGDWSTLERRPVFWGIQHVWRLTQHGAVEDHNAE